MQWIVLGETKGRVELVSRTSVTGMLPKGAFLTVESGKTRHVLRVDETEQFETYAPSPVIAELDLGSLRADQTCQNVIRASRVKDLSDRDDGLVDFIRPQALARRSTQDEIDSATGAAPKGPSIFVATLHSTQCQTLRDSSGLPIRTRIPESAFFHQILICGKTGSGKTVATKYLAQYFVEEFDGAVLAVNVKDIDFLQMERPSRTTSKDVELEWAALGLTPHGTDNFTIYHPSNIATQNVPGVDRSYCREVTLNVQEIDPDALTGLLTGITDAAAQTFPSIFRHWQHAQREARATDFSFTDFVNYFARAAEDGRRFETRSERGDSSFVTLHPGTYDNIGRNLNSALEFFDNPDAQTLEAADVLIRGKMSVINVTGRKGIQFGSVLLRDLLHKIVSLKDNKQSDVPILIIIDEVHQFYNAESSREALGDLDTICRTGRSKQIGVIFSSQSPSDIPRGLSSVINTQVFFKSDPGAVKGQGMKVSDEEVSNLRGGYAVGSIHDLPHVRVFKFPMSCAGVFEGAVTK